METTYRLVLVGPSWLASAANVAQDDWVIDHDEAVVTLDDTKQGIKQEQEESRAERARRLLEELEQEGASLEDSFKDDSLYLQNLDVFPEIAKPEDEAALPMELDTEALMMDLATMLPVDASPPHSPSPFFELDQLLQMRAEEVLPDPLDLLEDVLPPTPSDSGASSPGPQSSPSYAPSTPASIYSDSSNDPEWMPEPLPGPSKGRRKPYARANRLLDRVERKKLQNKNAATRYRTKKKEEEDELLEMEENLASKNRQLKEKVAEAEMEMRIVKGLLKKKLAGMGLLKKSA